MKIFAPMQLIASASILALSLANAHAGSVLVEGNVADQPISVSIDNAPLTDVLSRLGQIFSFSIKGLEKAGSKEKISGKYSGKLDVVLQRLLRNRNHMIVRVLGKKTTIDYIVLLSTYNAATPNVASKQLPGQRQQVNNMRDEGQLSNKARLAKLKRWNALVQRFAPKGAGQ